VNGIDGEEEVGRSTDDHDCGSLRVIRQPPIESLTAGIWDRLGILTKEVKAA
jgi:hypothetical protein